MSDQINKMDSQQLDIFKEIGNIGSGNAVTALATMLNKEIDMSVPSVKIVPFNEIVNILNGPESLVVGVLVGMSGDLNGYILMLMDPQQAYEMTSLAFGQKRTPPEVLNDETVDEMDRSALTEMANILIGSYLSAICMLTNLTVMPSVPQLAIDMVGAIISIVAIEYSQLGDSVLFLETQFADENSSIAGHFFLIPENESYRVLMESLGVEL